MFLAHPIRLSQREVAVARCLTAAREFESEDDVIIWMIDNQLARRNINDGIKYVLADQKREALERIGLKRKQEMGAIGGASHGIKVLSLSDKTFIEPIAIDSDPASIEQPQPKKGIAPHNTQKEIA